MPSLAIKHNFLFDTVWFRAKQVLRIFFPKRRPAVLEFAPNHARPLQFNPNRARVLEFSGEGG